MVKDLDGLRPGLHAVLVVPLRSLLKLFRAPDDAVWYAWKTLGGCWAEAVRQRTTFVSVLIDAPNTAACARCPQASTSRPHLVQSLRNVPLPTAIRGLWAGLAIPPGGITVPGQHPIVEPRGYADTPEAS